MDINDLNVRHSEVLSQLHNNYKKSEECDKKYSSEFPHDKDVEAKLEYNEKYVLRLKELRDERNAIVKELEDIEENIHSISPSFTPRKEI